MGQALRTLRPLPAISLFGALMLFPAAPGLAAGGGLPSGWPWWLLPLLLFGLTVVLGVVAALAGIGGGVLFVPLMAAIFPFVHVDFARGAGLMVALTGALAAGPTLLRQRLADLRLAIPVALVASLAAIFGARTGLAMPAQLVQVLLGAVIIAMFAVMLAAKSAPADPPARRDPLTHWLRLGGLHAPAPGSARQPWEPRRMALGLVLFAGVGFMAGMFGLGAGWANVPVLNLVMGVPIKIAVGTSYFLLAITDSSAAWVYLGRGAMLPLVVIPSVAGIMIGARVGARMLERIEPTVVRRIVLVVLFLAGARALLRGLGW